MYQILYIAIYNNKIGDEGAKAIAQALTYNNTLTKLCIRYYIGIWNNNIGDEGAKTIAQALTYNNKLTTLGIRYYI